MLKLDSLSNLKFKSVFKKKKNSRMSKKCAERCRIKQDCKEFEVDSDIVWSQVDYKL